MKTLLLLDSFKGTLSSQEANEIVRSVLQQYYPKKEILSLPFSDGGEGMLDVFQRLYPQAEKKHVMIKDAFLGEEMDASYLTIEDTAIIESAKANGITLLRKESNPYLTSTYGLGQIISDALTHGYHRFIIGLGGSCTNDGGAGMLSALGVSFIGKNDEFIPTGGTLDQIETVECHQTDKIKECEFTILSDVDNPLLGTQGATYVFSRQKGAEPNDLPILEEKMKHYKDIVISLCGKDYSAMPGAGAAGGLGFAFYSFFEPRFVSGGEYILSQYHFGKLLNDTEEVITGEGKTDLSSLHHKVVSVIARACQKKNVPCTLISGSVDNDVIPLLSQIGITSFYETNKDKSRTFDEIKKTAKEDLRQAVVKYSRNEKR